MEERLTTAYAQYLILSQCGEVAPQSAIKLINGEEFEVTADNGVFHFIVEDGKLRLDENLSRIDKDYESPEENPEDFEEWQNGEGGIAYLINGEEFTQYSEDGEEVRKSNDLDMLKADVDEFGGCILHHNGAFIYGSEWVIDEIKKRQNPPKQFEQGQKFENTDWFTGGEAVYTVSRKTKNKVYFTVYRWELDGEHNCKESFDIERDEDGNEFITIYEYHGHYNRIYA